MKLSKFDIGGEVISILTRGMYPDPRDAVREYIQNGVDAKSNDISVEVHQNTVVVEDEGTGMDRETMRKAVRVGVSDKNPTQNVGFMGIGIYSSFHLCNSLTIYSNDSAGPNKLTMDFSGMKGILKEEKALRLTSDIDSNQLTDLQTLLEQHITLTNNGELDTSEFPTQGTRVEMHGLSPAFYSEISDFNEFSQYMREVVPLHLDKEKFRWGEMIENRIAEMCAEQNVEFELVNINLQVHNQSDILYRPYKDENFYNNKPQEPQFEPMKANGDFFGVAWGCLNSARKKISRTDLRGFLIKKQGFAIGRRENTVKHFARKNTFFDRYIGEFVVVNEKMLPNASRADFEYSAKRTLFYEVLGKVAEKYDEAGHDFQEQSKAEEELGIMRDKLQKENKLFNEFEQNPEKLLEQIVRIKGIKDKIKIRLQRTTTEKETLEWAKKLKKETNELEKVIQQKILSFTKSKKRSSTSKRAIDIAKGLSEIDLPHVAVREYESLLELFEDLEIELNTDLRKAFQIIDEKFVQAVAENKKHYYELLNDLRDELIEEE